MDKFMGSFKDLKNLEEGGGLLLVSIIPFIVVIGIPVVVVAILVLEVRRKLSAKKEEKVTHIETISDKESRDKEKIRRNAKNKDKLDLTINKQKSNI